MTVKLVVIYPHPLDAEAFERAYHSHHMPLMRSFIQPPERTRTFRVLEGSSSSFYRIAEVHFATRAELATFFASPDGETLPPLSAMPIDRWSADASRMCGRREAVSVVIPLCAVALLLSFLKGAFGGGFGMLGVPLLALAMDPRQAAGLLAPLLVVMDAMALCFWPPATWSKRDLLLLAPFQLAGVALGFAALAVLDPRMVGIVMSATTLLFAVVALARTEPSRLAFVGEPVAGAVAGALSGFGSMVAHAGGAPIATYLQARGLSKTRYVGTTSIIFAFGNLAKLPAWVLISRLRADATWPLLAASIACLCGVFLGWRAHTCLDRGVLFAVCNALLLVSASCMLIENW